MKRAWLIITTYKRLLSFLHSVYSELWVFGGEGVAAGGGELLELETEVDRLQAKPSFWRNCYFYIVCKPFTRASFTEMALSISLSSSFIHRQIKMNLSRGRMYASSICSSEGLFLFSLKHNLSFLVKIPSTDTLRFPWTSSRSPATCFVPETLLKAKRWR